MKSSTATATTATAETCAYVGRFAPSPTGDLHLGSLLTATASYLDARAHRGQWLLRMEDLDSPREVPGAATRILRCLESFQFEWDGPVLHQSRRTPRYEQALEELQAQRKTFHCSCTRQQLQDLPRYPGTCRRNPPAVSTPAATSVSIRFAAESRVLAFEDRIQGRISSDPAGSVGDFVIRRRDGLIAYMLAVVVDDADQGVTHVIRGADLLDSTAAQIELQRALGYRHPLYGHVPVLTEPDGSKLSKSRRSLALDPSSAGALLWRVFELLGLRPPADLRRETPRACWDWGIGAWDIALVIKQQALALRD